MILLLRFGFVAVLLGLAVGLLLRVSLGRKRFGLLAMLAMLPLVGHAIYLLVLAGRAEVPLAAVLGFGLPTLALVVVAALLGRGYAARRPWYALLVPLVAAVAYFVLATAILTPSWESREYAPDALAAAIYGLFTLFAVAVLAPFAPRGGAVPPAAGAERP